MSDEKRYTERDLIRARREGYAKHCEETATCQWSREAREQFAAAAYPLPKVTRPRVVAGLRAQYKVVDGVVHGRSNASFDWRVSASIHVDDVVRVANLLANPTEEITE